MAYSASTPARKILDLGFASAGSVFVYQSTHTAVEVAATGFFAGCGAGGNQNYGATGAAADIGMKVGDIVIASETTSGTNPGRTTLHAVTASTANQASTTASTGYNAAYNVTVSAHAST